MLFARATAWRGTFCVGLVAVCLQGDNVIAQRPARRPLVRLSRIESVEEESSIARPPVYVIPTSAAQSTTGNSETPELLSGVPANEIQYLAPSLPLPPTRPRYQAPEGMIPPSETIHSPIPQPSIISPQPTPVVPPVAEPTPSADIPRQTQSHVPSSDDPLHTLLVETAQDLLNQPATDVQSVNPGWWFEYIPKSLRPEASDYPLSVEEVLIMALTHSKQIRVFSELPLIRETSITEANAAFDWHAFLDTRWDDLSDPVGNSLTAGPGITRFRDNHLTSSGGLRKRTATGGTFEARQDFGFQDNNSQFFVPSPQGTSRIALSFTQPLLRGRGKAYNYSLVCLADIDSKIAHDEFSRQLQSHLLEVSRSYWAIYLERGILYQKLNTYHRANEIVVRLEKRQSIDASRSQIQSAQAALAERRSDLLRAQAAVQNAESRLRALVNAPAFGDFESTEIIPIDRPGFQMIPVNMHGALGEAVQFRPEVAQALKQIQSAALRLEMSKNELLPVLNLVTETYVAGLAANGDAGRAWTNQFNQGEPGYSIGLQFEVPLGNRAALARSERRQLELRQLQSQYEVTLQTVQLEVEVAVREVSTSQQELLSKEQAVRAREQQLNYLTKRWERLPGEDVSASLMLENILNAQDRLAIAERDYLQSQITYNLSLTNLKKTTGMLLQQEDVSIGRACVDGLPMQVLDKSPSYASPEMFNELPASP